MKGVNFEPNWTEIIVGHVRARLWRQRSVDCLRQQQKLNVIRATGIPVVFVAPKNRSVWEVPTQQICEATWSRKCKFFHLWDISKNASRLRRTHKNFREALHVVRKVYVRAKNDVVVASFQVYSLSCHISLISNRASKKQRNNLYTNLYKKCSVQTNFSFLFYFCLFRCSTQKNQARKWTADCWHHAWPCSY